MIEDGVIENYECDQCNERHNQFVSIKNEDEDGRFIEIECTSCHMITGMHEDDL
ncbi:hypothetical protein [Salipaludibacillus sp. CF4.18]|uniref:hypothetical protein n=1 Tax=Salipaludibacillus sp. CF4.18 TaxID=3373081 RepID=UPI003EE436C8